MSEELERLEERVSEAGLGIWLWIDQKFLAISTTYQLVAIVAALGLAVLIHRPVRRFLARMASRWRDAAMVARVLQTLSSISVPVVWTVGLWVANSVFLSMGQPFGLTRLAASLINAWIVIRVATSVMPSAYWSNIFAWCAWSIAALNAVGLREPAVRILDDASIPIGSGRLSLLTVMEGLAAAALLIWLAYGFSGFIQRRLERARSLNASMRVLVAKLVRYVLIIIAAVAGLSAVGIDLTAFAVFSGAVGVGVGLGLQRTVSNLIAGFSLLADRSLKPGDVIEITTSYGPTFGTVRSLGARYVAVRARDGTETLIPNEMLISNPVTNWSYTDKRVRRSLPIGVSYSSDVDKAIELCLAAALDTNRVLPQPAPVCHLRGFGDSSVDLELRIWIEDPEDGVANVASDVYRRIWRLFKEHDIEIPFPQRDVRIRHAEGAEAAALSGGGGDG